MKQRIAWWMVCLLPQRVAVWWAWGPLRIPNAWVPYVFGRSIGCENMEEVRAAEVKR